MTEYRMYSESFELVSITLGVEATYIERKWFWRKIAKKRRSFSTLVRHECGICFTGHGYTPTESFLDAMNKYSTARDVITGWAQLSRQLKDANKVIEPKKGKKK